MADQTKRQQFVDSCKNFTIKVNGEDKQLVTLLEKHCHQEGCTLAKDGVCRLTGKKKGCVLGSIGLETKNLGNPFYVLLKERQEAEALFVQSVLGGDEDGIQ
jgi:hypothetical protein